MMIAAQANTPQLTPEDYFVGEEQQLEKYEYIEMRPYHKSDMGE